jgi:hypothetical protein
MALSVCLLTRNEEANLPRVLASVAGLADEVVVADTGSTDRTREVAAQRGARVYSVGWQDDFAAGRNSALARATGDWVLWLNPDEEFLADSRDQLRACLANQSAFGYLVRVQELTRAGPPDFVTETVQLRLFRRRPEVRFLGRLHPRFEPPLEDLARREGKQILASGLLIRHHAYLSVLTDDKLRWAARLLELELRDRPGQLHYLIEYGRTLLLLGDPKGHDVLAQAADQVWGARDNQTAPTPAAARLLEYLLTVSPAQSRSRLTREEALELARRWFPTTPPLLWAAAQFWFAREDYRRAAELLERLVQCGATGVYDRSAAFDSAIISEAAAMNLGSCYVRLGQPERAEHCLRPLLNHPAYQAQASQNLALVENLRRRGRPGDSSALGPTEKRDRTSSA